MADPAAIAAAAALGLGTGAALVDWRARMRERAAAAAFPPAGHMLEVGGRRVHAVVSGTGNPGAADVVLIHGAGGSVLDWGFGMSALLAARHRVVAFDRPGLGWSDGLGAAGIDPAAQAAALRAGAAALGLRRPVIVGHSYGAAVALAWALADPAGVRGLVLVGGAAMPWEGTLGPLYALAAHPVGGALAVPLIAAFAPRRWIDATIWTIFAPDPVPPGYYRRIGSALSLRRAAIRANARQVMGLRAHLARMAPHYAGLSLPVELIHGTADRIVPLDHHAAPLAARLPRARLTSLQGVGHMAHHSHPGTVAEAVARLVANTA